MISADQVSLIIAILVPMLGAFWTILHKMDQKFDKVDQKFDKVDQKFDKVDQRFEKIEHELQDIKTRLTVLETVMGILSGGLHIQHQNKEKTNP